MPYSASLPFGGNTDKAFGLAEAALTGIGFRLSSSLVARRSNPEPADSRAMFCDVARHML